ncbi:MAG: acetate/propionate family kinase [Nitrospinota bacterium]
MKVLVSNVGSTSFKHKLLEMDDESVLASGKVERVGGPKGFLSHEAAGREKVTREAQFPDHNAAIKMALELLLDKKHGALKELSEIAAVGFKTVHGGRFTGSLALTEDVLQEMEGLSKLMPAHNPPYVSAIRVFQGLLPGVPLVGVFETAFHRDLPPKAFLYSIPYEWYERFGIRRYGFHGASHRYISERVPEILGKPRDSLKVISCHLGGSSSLCAIDGGRSIDTSMGFSAQAGVSMSTRSGDIDPFIIPYLVERGGLSLEEVRQALVKRGGLLGVSGVSGDVRDLEEAAEKGNERALLALELFCYEVKKYIGAYAAALGGLDALAFTGGIGENGVGVRASICEGLGFLGIELDGQKNLTRGQEAIISREGSAVKVMVVPANEELIVARETLSVVQSQKES